MVVPLAEEETPRIHRNKQMRANAMAAISSLDIPEPPSTTPRGHRRKGSVSGRGKRVSSSFEVTGNISEWFFFVVSFGFYLIHFWKSSTT
jgi:kinetochore protein Mis13/DSN1